jgi:LysM repeat protein
MNKIAPWCLAIMMTLSMSGCLVSEADYEQVVTERNMLRQKLADVQRQLEESQKENDVINLAIKEIYEEREKLLTQIESLQTARRGTGSASADGVTDPTGRSSASGDRSAVYVVQPNDTLSGISAKTGVSISELMRLNNIREENIVYVGLKLRLK